MEKLLLKQTVELEKCNAQQTAALAVSVNGGKGPFEYAWNVSDLSGNKVQNIAAGNYEVTISDSEGTQATAKFSVPEPETLTAEIIENKLTSNENSKDNLGRQESTLVRFLACFMFKITQIVLP